MYNSPDVIPGANVLSSSTLFRNSAWCNGICRPYKSIRIIRACALPRQFLLSRLIRIMPPHQITIFLGSQQWNEMDSRPHFLARKLILLPDTLPNFVESEGHDADYARQHHHRPEAPRG